MSEYSFSGRWRRWEAQVLTECQQTDLIIVDIVLWVHRISLSCCTKYCDATSYRTIKSSSRNYFRKTSYGCFLFLITGFDCRDFSEIAPEHERGLCWLALLWLVHLLVCCVVKLITDDVVLWTLQFLDFLAYLLSRHYWGTILPNGQIIASTAAMCLRSIFFCY